MTCVFEACAREPVATWSKREGAEPSVCALHFWYFGTLLSDPWYRNHPVPELDEVNAGAQPALLAEETRS